MLPKLQFAIYLTFYWSSKRCFSLLYFVYLPLMTKHSSQHFPNPIHMSAVKLKKKKILISVQLVQRQVIWLTVVFLAHSCNNSLPPSFPIFKIELLKIEMALNLFSSQLHRQFIVYSVSKRVPDSLQSLQSSSAFTSVFKLSNEFSKKDTIFYFTEILDMLDLDA